jgi:membrane protein implicated in regulation of membrane protease activity
MEIFGFDVTAMEYWHWFAFAGIFFVLEVLTMGFFFLWFGVSAVFVGLLLLIFATLGWELQFLIWGAMAVADAVAWRFIIKSKNKNTDGDLVLNRRGEQYIGRTFTLEEPIVNGYSKIKVDDTHWSVQCDEELPVGSKIRVKAIKGTVFEVEAF